MLYTIGKVTEQESKAGKMYKRVDVKDSSGVITRDVAVMGFVPFYAQVVTNAQVEGILKTKDFNGKPSHTLEAPYEPKTGGGGKRVDTLEVAIKKNELYDKSNEKEQKMISTGVRVSSTFTAAWNTTIALFAGKEFTHDEFQKEFKMWRRYFVNNYDIEENPALTSHGTEVPWPEDKSSSLTNASDDNLDSFNSEEIPF